MNRPSSARSMINKFFYIFIIACLLLTAYGIYVYVQDSNASIVLEPRETIVEDSPVTELKEEEAPENFQVLDKRVETDVKTSLLEKTTEHQKEESLIDTHDPIIMDVSFSRYNQSQETFSAGFVLINDPEKIVSSCSLQIKTDAEQMTLQKSNIIGQHGVSGCRFNDIALSDLPAPSQTSPWKIIVQGNNTLDQNLVTLERDVFSTADLNNLING